MIYASARCPACHTETAYPVEDNALTVTCFGCGQNNIIQTKEPINGLCANCGKPIDDEGHVIGKDGITGCRNKGNPLK